MAAGRRVLATLKACWRPARAFADVAAVEKRPQAHKEVGYKFHTRGRRTFVDLVNIRARAGDGGNGCCSFRREKYVDRGGPDGGDGGDGGNVVVQAVRNHTTLLGVRQTQIAQKGEHGKGKMMHGKRGAGVLIEVPIGTVVRRRELATADRPAGEWSLVADLDRESAKVVICAGGKGGQGNPHFATSILRAPQKATKGTKGEQVEVEMELKTLADVGLVGLPNAGKSTFLRAVSNAHPRVAPYPFTTLNPFIGTIDYRDHYQVTMADIPGLIAGAHRNVGLGHQFLRHIERASVLVYIIDISGGALGEQRFIDRDDRGVGQSVQPSRRAALKLQDLDDNTRDFALMHREPERVNWEKGSEEEFLEERRNPWEDLATLQQELNLFNPALTAKPSLIVANKMDLDQDGKCSENLEILRTKTSLPILAVSAMKGHNVTEVTTWLRKVVEQLNPTKKSTTSTDYL